MIRFFPSADDIGKAVQTHRELAIIERKLAKSRPRIEEVILNVYLEGKPFRVAIHEPIFATYVKSDDLPTEVKINYTWEKEQWLVVLRADRHWERKNGRETGNYRDENIVEVSRVRTDKYGKND